MMPQEYRKSMKTKTVAQQNNIRNGGNIVKKNDLQMEEDIQLPVGGLNDQFYFNITNQKQPKLQDQHNRLLSGVKSGFQNQIYIIDSYELVNEPSVLLGQRPDPNVQQQRKRLPFRGRKYKQFLPRNTMNAALEMQQAQQKYRKNTDLDQICKQFDLEKEVSNNFKKSRMNM